MANLVIGFALLALLHTPFVEHNSAVVSTRDSVLSWQMAKLSGAVPFDSFAFIDADEATQAAWGFNPVTPRAQIAKLVTFALKAKPSVVLIDLDLTWPSANAASGDVQLARVLAAHTASCVRACTPVLLVRAVAPTPRFAFASSPDRMALSLIPSFLDKALRTNPTVERAPGIEWGTADNQQDDDGAVRRWYLWTDACVNEGKAVALPSVALLAAAAASDTPLNNVRARLQTSAATCVKRGDAMPRIAAARGDESLRLRSVTVSLSSNGIERRIFYRLPWPANADDSNDDGRLLVLKAGTILSHAASDASLLRGKVVVIGSSAAVAGDREATPLGIMPGSVVLINAISTLIRGDQLHDLGVVGTIGIELFLIVLVSYLFAVLPATPALVLSLAIVFAGTLTVGFAALNSGAWIDSVFPAVGVILHEAFHRARDYIHALKQTPYKHTR
ncbi:MAG TPA: CHASE2 domain-containing protein [Candidatus Rubrimentiphilum sp.]|nr:CHASE2 domain-containing protein [Candidatus Rubrimentiphilum sp.]